jgi:hypothetical protein
VNITNIIERSIAMKTAKNLLKACIKIDNCQGGTLAYYLPKLSSTLKRYGKLWNDKGTKFTYINLIRVFYKDCIIAELQTTKTLADFDLLDIPENCFT